MKKPTRKLRENSAGENTVWVSFKIDADVVKTLDLAAAREDRSRASVIRRLIVKHHEELLEQPA